MSKFIVTGGCGFIGHHLVHRLVKDGGQVVVIDDLSAGSPDAIPDRAELIRCDASDTGAYAEALATSDVLYHLAAIPSVARSIEAPQETRRVNFGSVEAITEHLRAEALVLRTVFTSSAAVYGDLQESSAAIDGLTLPINPYGQDKLDAERVLLSAREGIDLPVDILRLFNVYGPGQRSDSMYSGVITTFMNAASQGGALTLHGDGSQVRDFIHVDDVVESLIQLPTSSGQPLRNLCTGIPTSISELAELIISTTGSASVVRHSSARAGDIQHSLGVPDPEFSAAVPPRGLAQGLEGMLAENLRPI